MVTNATSLGRTGLQDWLVQRVSAVIIGLYVIFLLLYWAFHGEITYYDWQALFSHLAMRLFSLAFLVSLAAHAWIGLWTVVTDYIKCSYLRIAINFIVIFANLFFVFWGIQILWGLSA